jgi:hypothetical protein
MARNDLQGSLDLLVLKTLSQVEKLHGYGIVLHIQRASDELLRIEEGSLYPALHRMEERMDWRGVVPDGDRQEGEVLPVDGRRTQRAGAGGEEL